MGKSAVVIGATGLVGGQLVKLLVGDSVYDTVKIFSRRTLGLSSPKIVEHLVDFDKIEDWESEITGDVLFSAMGTTIKKAGSKKVQYKIDYTYQFEVARAAASQGVKNYVLVSSLGANSKSKIFYSRMKGELDLDVQQLPFKSINIVRPSGLIGDRDEERAGETTMIKIASALIKILPFLKKHKPIPAETVAKAMIYLNAQSKPGANIVNNTDLFTIANA